MYEGNCRGITVNWFPLMEKLEGATDEEILSFVSLIEKIVVSDRDDIIRRFHAQTSKI